MTRRETILKMIDESKYGKVKDIDLYEAFDCDITIMHEVEAMITDMVIKECFKPIPGTAYYMTYEREVC